MPTYMLICCGTSVLTYGADEATRQRCNRLANKTLLEPEDQRWLDGLVGSTSRALEAGGLEEARRRSAEVNSLAAYFEGLPRPGGQPDFLVLLHTDSALGRAAAEVLKRWLEAQGCVIQLVSSPGLSTRSLEEFQDALSGLVHWAWDVLPGFRNAGYRVVFNLTGGFKGVLAFLQVLGTFLADETVYLFEGSRDLLRIPRLPVRLAGEETVRQNLEAFRRMAVLGSAPARLCEGLPETLYFRNEDRIGLTPWGEMVWNQARESLYEEGLLEPLSGRFRYTEAFRKAVGGLPKNLLRTLNKNLDLLARMFELPDNPNPRSLNFHTLAKPQDGCTHELYASSEHGAPRCYGRFHGTTFHLERYGAHL